MRSPHILALTLVTVVHFMSAPLGAQHESAGAIEEGERLLRVDAHRVVIVGHRAVEIALRVAREAAIPPLPSSTSTSSIPTGDSAVGSLYREG